MRGLRHAIHNLFLKPTVVNFCTPSINPEKGVKQWKIKMPQPCPVSETTLRYYPLSLGRNFAELYRALIALQTSEAFNVATPADWQPGDDVIVSPAGSCGVAKDRMDGKEDMQCQDWFFCTKKIGKEAILEKILKKS